MGAGIPACNHFGYIITKVKKYTSTLLLAAVGYGLWMLTYSPDILDWINKGLPSITGSMKAESPFIEFVREFFGLLLCLLTCLYYWNKGRTRK